MLRRVHKRLALRVVRGYRTVSYEAATVLSPSPPSSIGFACWHATYYNSHCETREWGLVLMERKIEALEHRARLFVLQQWQQRLAKPTTSQRTIGVVRPLLPEWLGRGFGSLSY